MIKFNEHGNVLIRNKLLGSGSNILDLLQASVSSCAKKPVGFSEFQKSLRQINVPKIFLAESHLKPEQGNHGSAKQGIGNGNSKRNDTKITKWETY